MKPYELEWRYVAGHNVSHGFLKPPRHDTRAPCGLRPWVGTRFGWLGGADDMPHERERARHLMPKCKTCVRILQVEL